MKRIVFVFSALLLVPPALAQNGPLDLSQALSLARTDRATVAAAQQRVIASQALRNSLGAFPATKVSLGISSSVEAGGSDDDLVISQPLDIFGRRSASASLGDAEIHRAEASLQQVLADVQFEVIEEFSSAASARALAQSASATKDIAQQLYTAIKTLVDEGRSPGVELTRVGIELERARLKELQRDSELAGSLERLAALLNVPSGALEVAQFANLEMPMEEPTTLLKRRPDLLILSSAVALTEAEARSAKLINMPELEVQARRSAWQDRDARFGARIQLSFPLTDYGRASAEQAAAKATALAARKALEDATRIAEAEITSTRTELASAMEQIKGYEAIVQSARTLVERSRAGYTDRAVTLIELLEATRALREVEEGHVEAQRRLATAQARYLRATGTMLEIPK